MDPMSAASREPASRPRTGRGILAPALAAVVLLAAGLAVVVWSGATSRRAGVLEHEEASAYSTIRVRRDGDVRTLSFVRDDGQEAVQSRLDLTAPHTLLSPYARGMFTSYLYQPHPRRVLIVGLGGGAMVRFLTHHEPDVRVDAVEIDPVVVRLAAEYFGVRSGGPVQIHTADAVAFIESTEERYDLILMDAFLRPSAETDATGVPSGLKTRAFLGRLKSVLAPGGVVAFNMNEHDRLADDVTAVREVFGPVALYRCPPAANQVLVAGADGLAADAALETRIVDLDARFSGALAFRDLLKNRE